MEKNTAPTSGIAKFNERVQRVEDAVALKEASRIPVAPFFASAIQRLYDSSYRDIFYDYRRAGDAYLRFYNDYPQCDAHYFSGFTSGRSLELALPTMIDWPGRPGTRVSIYSSHQVIEHEYLLPEEYPELLGDYTGFMLRKYIPRAFSGLQGLSGFSFSPTIVLSTSLLKPMLSQDALDAYRVLAGIALSDAEAAAVAAEYSQKLTDMGFPPMMTGVSQAPYDILGDYFRGTVGMMMDLLEYEDAIEAACEMFAAQQIEALQYFRAADLPVKRVFFPLHKGMDGFMSPAQYERLYWKPLKKIMAAIMEMGVTPILYTEGRYNSRLEQLADVPKGKVIYHFEDVDMKEAKRVLGGVACIAGNLPGALLEYGKKEAVADYCKFLIDTCAPGGGYIFDMNCCLENAKRENLDTMFETLETYR